MLFDKKGGSRTDTMIKLVLIFFISLLAFSVGTYVGKQVSDSDHRRAQIEGDFQNVATHEVGAEDGSENAGATEASEEKLSDADIASLTEEFVNKEKESVEAASAAQPQAKERDVASEDSSGYKKFDPKADPHAKEAHPTPKTQPQPAQPAPKAPTPHAQPTASSEPMPAAQRVAKGEPPSPDLKEPRRPDSVLPASVATTAVGKFTVQVASYPDEAEAKNHAANLKAKGWDAFYLQADIQGKTWYRVSVGLFSSAKMAMEHRKLLQKDAKVESAIVQKIIN